MSTRLRKATLRQYARQRERERHFKNVKLCPNCGACLKFVPNAKWPFREGHYECPTCGPVKIH